MNFDHRFILSTSMYSLDISKKLYCAKKYSLWMLRFLVVYVFFCDHLYISSFYIVLQLNTSNMQKNVSLSLALLTYTYAYKKKPMFYDYFKIKAYLH